MYKTVLFITEMLLLMPWQANMKKNKVILKKSFILYSILGNLCLNDCLVESEIVSTLFGQVLNWL